MPWSDPIAIIDDVKNRFQDVVNATADDAEIQTYIDRAKEELGIRLDAELQSKWKEIPDPDSVTDIKDLIQNTDVFKRAHVALTLKLIYEDNSYNDEDMNAQRARNFEREFREFYKIGLQLMQFDLNQDSNVSMDEKAKSPVGNRFYRV